MSLELTTKIPVTLKDRRFHIVYACDDIPDFGVVVTTWCGNHFKAEDIASIEITQAEGDIDICSVCLFREKARRQMQEITAKSITQNQGVKR